jgi:DNA-directed RNA polymerase sigma subunit (sigma70/sigma32)
VGRGRPSSDEEDVELATPQAVRDLVAGFPPLQPESLDRLLTDQHGPELSPAQAQRLVEGNLWLVLEAAEARESETLPLEDLFQEGSSALVTLVHGLDPAHPLSPAEFLSRVRQVVRQVMDAQVAEEEEARLEDLRWAADAERLLAAETELRLQSEAVPSEAELAAHLDWPLARVAQLRRAVDEARTQNDAELLDILGEIEGS